MTNTIYFMGQHWEVSFVDDRELPPNCLALSDWESLSIKILKDVPVALREEILIHEAIELLTLDNQIVENIRGSVRTIGEMADHIAEVMDSHIASLIRENPSWFPLIRGEKSRSKDGSRMSEGTLGSGHKTSFTT